MMNRERVIVDECIYLHSYERSLHVFLFLLIQQKSPGMYHFRTILMLFIIGTNEIKFLKFVIMQILHRLEIQDNKIFRIKFRISFLKVYKFCETYEVNFKTLNNNVYIICNFCRKVINYNNYLKQKEKKNRQRLQFYFSFFFVD